MPAFFNGCLYSLYSKCLLPASFNKSNSANRIDKLSETFLSIHLPICPPTHAFYKYYLSVNYMHDSTQFWKFNSEQEKLIPTVRKLIILWKDRQ